MKEKIEKAREFENAIQIISEESCRLGVYALQFEFAERFGSRLDDVVIIPILRGGKRIGEKIPSNLKVDFAPMQMSYYDDKNQRVESPICKVEPVINKIIVNGKTRNVVFAEGVVDSEGTIKKSIQAINIMIDKFNVENKATYAYPEYHVFALVSKVNGDSTIPNFVYSNFASTSYLDARMSQSSEQTFLKEHIATYCDVVYAFKVDSRIWVHGWGVDNGQKGREEDSIFGILSPYADSVPEEPYFTESDIFNKYFRQGII